MENNLKPASDLIYRIISDAESCTDSIKSGKGSKVFLEKAYQERLADWQQGVKEGFDEACWLLGRCYEEGIGVERDTEKAVSLYKDAVSRNYAPAQHSLGHCYETGIGLSQDIPLAVEWYQKAALQNYGPSQETLYHLYREGQGIPQNIPEAFKWFRLAAEQDVAHSAAYLALCYEEGDGVEKNIQEALTWWRKAGEQSDCEAVLILAAKYLHGRNVPQDVEEGLRWMRRGLDLNIPEIQFLYGLSLFNGDFVAKNVSEAEKYFRLATEQGDKDAQEYLDKFYKSSEGNISLQKSMKEDTALSDGSSDAFEYLESSTTEKTEHDSQATTKDFRKYNQIEQASDFLSKRAAEVRAKYADNKAFQWFIRWGDGYWNFQDHLNNGVLAYLKSDGSKRIILKMICDFLVAIGGFILVVLHFIFGVVFTVVLFTMACLTMCLLRSKTVTSTSKPEDETMKPIEASTFKMWPTEPENSFLEYLFSKEPQEEVIQEYLRKGVNLNTVRGDSPDDKETLLMTVIYDCDEDNHDFPAIKLIDLGADVSFITPDGSCALSQAVSGHRPEIVKRLLDAGANPNFMVDYSFDGSLLDKANVDWGYHEQGGIFNGEEHVAWSDRLEIIVKTLTEYGAKPGEELRADKPVYWLRMNGFDPTGLTTLWGHIEIEKLGVPADVIGTFHYWKSTYWDSWQDAWGPKPPTFNREFHNKLGDTVAREIRKYLYRAIFNFNISLLIRGLKKKVNET
jgi:TPR repeat protein